MSKNITQDMAYRQSLMKYTEKYGVSRASRKYNKSRSYIYFWKQRWDGSVASLACQSRRPHSHPNQHTEAELKLIRDMRRRNPTLGMVELWHRLRQRGYTRRPESLFRIMRKMGMFPPEKPKKTYKPKPYEQMTYPGQRVQVDVYMFAISYYLPFIYVNRIIWRYHLFVKSHSGYHVRKFLSYITTPLSFSLSLFPLNLVL